MKSTKKKKKTGGWQDKFLSLRGRLILINSMLSAVPLYQTLIFRMLKWARKKINKIRREFCEGKQIEK